MNHDLYGRFLGMVRELNTARAVEALLDWDQETLMPPRGAEDRAAQISLLAGIIHERLTSPELGEALERLERDGVADSFEAAVVVRELRREYERATRLPRELVRELARVCTLAKGVWAEARRESDFARFAPHLRRIMALKRESADCIGWTTEPYDALLDEFEPGARAAEIATLFQSVQADLLALLERIRGARRRPDLSVLERPYDAGALDRVVRAIAAALGYDFSAGRLDVSAHPFCTSFSPRDVRITTRYTEKLVSNPIFSVIHEVGHALYEQGFEPQHAYTPLAAAVSLGIHESQSRLWENLVGRSRPFWEHFYPQLCAALPHLADVSLDDWHFAINDVRPSLIRVDADEVTYNLHILLRFDLERRLIRGELDVDDVPAAWNARMKELLGISPSTDAEGCLQDIHWSSGLVGYFPTYALGNLYAAQFFEAARRDLPDLERQFAAGRFLPLREWLREKIHRHGRSYRAAELVQRVTGRPLSKEPFVAHLTSKFEPLYGL